MIVALLLAGAQAAAATPPAPVTYTNEEEVYFAKEAGKAPPPWLALRREGERWVAVDAFGTPLAQQPQLKRGVAGETLAVTLADGNVTTLRRARPVTCWGSVRRDKPKADGSEDWTFQPRLKIHDQGGRARIGGDGAREAVIRMRNVVWPSGNNRPSLVLYIHTPDAPDHAVSYAWADPGAARIGINLRWVQASCTVDGLDAPAASSKQP